MTAPLPVSRHETPPACLRHGLGSASRFTGTDMTEDPPSSRMLLVNHHRPAGTPVPPLLPPQLPSFPPAGSSSSHTQTFAKRNDALSLATPEFPGPSSTAGPARHSSALVSTIDTTRGKPRRGSSRNSSTPLAAMAPPPPPEEPHWLLSRGLTMSIGGVGMKALEPRTRVVPVRDAEEAAASPSPTEPGKPSVLLDSPRQQVQGLGSLKELVDRDSGDGAEPGPDHSVPLFPEEPSPGGVSAGVHQAAHLGVDMGGPHGVCTAREHATQQAGSQAVLLSQDDVELFSAVAPGLLPGVHHAREGSHCTCGCAEGTTTLSLPICRSLPPPPAYNAITSWGGPMAAFPNSRSSKALLSVREGTQDAEDEEGEGEGEGVVGRLRAPSDSHRMSPAGTHSPGPGGGFEVEISLVSLRGYSQGVSDVIGALDFDSSGAFFATGGIARKVRVYSMANLAVRKAELVASLEERRSKSSGEDPTGDGESGTVDEGLEDEGDSGEGGSGDWDWNKRRRRSGSEFSAAAGGPGGSAVGGVAGAGAGVGVGTVPFFMREGNGGLRRKHKASSTGNLEDLFQQACRQRVREQFLDSDSCASQMICTAAKLSSLQWVPGKPGVVGCGDYDGVFTEWDLETGMCSSERDEHQGQKIWSIRYSPDHASGLAATASEDGTVKLWEAGSEDCVGSILPCPGSAACAVDFSADGRSLVTGGANSSLFLYDLRNLAAPLAVLQGHERTVSYCRFLNNSTVVSSSIDSTVKVWNVASAASDAAAGGAGVHPRRRALGAVGSGSDHANTRNFAGLAVRGDGLILTGAETNEMVAYRCRQGVMGAHMRMDFATGQCFSVPKVDSPPSLGRKPFVSALNWQGTAGTHLGAANSEGIIRIMRVL